MTVFIVIPIALLMFAFGLLVGFTIEIKPKKTVKFNKVNSQIQKEYQNFLNYDGTTQE